MNLGACTLEGFGQNNSVNNNLSAIDPGNSVQNLGNNYHISSYSDDLICPQEAARTAPLSSPTSQKYDGGIQRKNR